MAVIVWKYGSGNDGYTNGKKKGITYFANTSDVKLFAVNVTGLTVNGILSTNTFMVDILLPEMLHLQPTDS